MANFIKLTRSDGTREIEFYLNADHLSQFQPDDNDGTLIGFSKALNTVALGLSDSIRVKETPAQVENMIASRSLERIDPVSISYKYASARQTDFDGRLTEHYKDGCRINPNNIYAIFLNYTEPGTHCVHMTGGHYFEINDSNLGKIIPQDSNLHFAQAAQLPLPAQPTVQPPYQKPVQLVLAL